MDVTRLEGAKLDAAVAQALGMNAPDGSRITLWDDVPCIEGGGGQAGSNMTPWSPSTNWQHGGPIIERERIDLSFSNGERDGQILGCEAWKQMGCYGPTHRWGPTPLIAAMRSYVASKQ